MTKTPKDQMYIDPRRSFTVYDDNGEPCDMRDDTCAIDVAECFIVYANEWDNEREVWFRKEQATFATFADAVTYVKFTRKCNSVYLLGESTRIMVA